jgi:hypothetical protein
MSKKERRARAEVVAYEWARAAYSLGDHHPQARKLRLKMWRAINAATRRRGAP